MSTFGLEHGAAHPPIGAGLPGLVQLWQRGLTRWLSRLTPQPASADSTIAADARAVRELAHTLHRCDPGFAADLYAAADRHEQQLTAR